MRDGGKIAAAIEVLRDVLERLPSHPNSRIDELLPHRWSKPDA